MLISFSFSEQILRCKVWRYKVYFCLKILGQQCVWAKSFSLNWRWRWLINKIGAWESCKYNLWLQNMSSDSKHELFNPSQNPTARLRNSCSTPLCHKKADHFSSHCFSQTWSFGFSKAWTWVTRLEQPKCTKDDVKRPKGRPARCQAPEGPRDF